MHPLIIDNYRTFTDKLQQYLIKPLQAMLKYFLIFWAISRDT